MWRAEVNIAKLVEGVPLVGACERDWCEHEEFFSRKISVPRQRNTRKRVLRKQTWFYKTHAFCKIFFISSWSFWKDNFSAPFLMIKRQVAGVLICGKRFCAAA